MTRSHIIAAKDTRWRGSNRQPLRVSLGVNRFNEKETLNTGTLLATELFPLRLGFNALG